MISFSIASFLRAKNVGSLENKGWELFINTGRFLKKGKFHMTASANIAQNINTITEMDPTVLASMNGEYNYTNGSYLQRIQIGNAVGSIYGFKWKGIYQYSDYSEVEVPGVSGPNAPVVKDADGNVILNSKGRTKPMMFSVIVQ